MTKNPTPAPPAPGSGGSYIADPVTGALTRAAAPAPVANEEPTALETPAPPPPAEADTAAETARRKGPAK